MPRFFLTANAFALLLIPLASVRADQECQLNECPVQVNGLLQSSMLATQTFSNPSVDKASYSGAALSAHKQSAVPKTVALTNFTDAGISAQGKYDDDTNQSGRAASWTARPWFWLRDLIPNAGPNEIRPADGDEGSNFFDAAPVLDWSVLGIVCFLLCFLDFFLSPCVGSVGAVCFWISVAIAFNVHVAVHSGSSAKGWAWLAGYLMEWMLSVDNVFVFHLIFKTFKTPPEQMHKAVFIGVIGALVMRMMFFMLISGAVRVFSHARYFLGAVLVWSGVQAAVDGGDDEKDVADSAVVRCLKLWLGSRLSESYEVGGRLLCTDKNTGRTQATLLLVVIVCIEVTDLVFAVDSVTAKVAQIPDQYIAFSSSALAMFGLRATFFVVRDLVDMFALLKYGICIILVFLGIEIMFARTLHLPPSTMCVVILCVFSICILASAVAQRRANM